MAANSSRERETFFERDRHGNLRTVVYRRPSSSSHSHTRSRSSNSISNSLSPRFNRSTDTSPIISYPKDTGLDIASENSGLRAALTVAQEQAWVSARNEATWRTRVDEKDHEVTRLLDKLADEQRRVDKLEDKIKLMKRGSSRGSEISDLKGDINHWQSEVERKDKEIEALRRRIDERDTVIRVGEQRLLAKNEKIIELKEYLRRRGFNVD